MKHEPVLNALSIEMAKYGYFDGVKFVRSPVILADGTWFAPDCDAVELRDAWLSYVNKKKKTKFQSLEVDAVMNRFGEEIAGMPSALLWKKGSEVALQLIDEKVDESYLIAANGMPYGIKMLYFSRNFISANLDRVMAWVLQALRSDADGSQAIKLGQSTFLIYR